jgi:hypothetical protein
MYCDLSGGIFSFLNNVQHEPLFLEFIMTLVILFLYHNKTNYLLTYLLTYSIEQSPS